MNLKTQEWNDSYARGENAIFYPHEELVRFLNRFVRKRISQDVFSDVIYRGEFYHSGIGITSGGEVIESAPNAHFSTRHASEASESRMLAGGGQDETLGSLRPLKALDFGCGIGRGSVLMAEFGIHAYGIDISQNAIAQAQALYQDLCRTQSGLAPVDLRIYDGNHIPFEENSFDFTISYGVLDSMPFSLAQSLVGEIARVSKTYFFCSLIGEDSTQGFSNITQSTFTDEVEVQEAHEKGTIQSFFDYEKIQKLFAHTPFKIIWAEKKQSTDLFTQAIQSRYYIVCKKEVQ